nr:MAG TPA: hypothetical protein [Siphoviridae sp. ctnoo6]DAL19312.1 MAG TPA_asm: hypothetical protein [Caudoviricetes sp.]
MRFLPSQSQQRVRCSTKMWKPSGTFEVPLSIP